MLKILSERLYEYNDHLMSTVITDRKYVLEYRNNA